jgi:stringent starvation protein B
MNEILNRDKFKTLNKLINDEYVLIHINPEIEGTELPPHLANQPTVTLKISRLFRGNVVVENRIVRAELLFGSTYFECIIPLEAVWACTSVGGFTQVWETNEKIEKLLEEAMVPYKKDSPQSGSEDDDKHQSQLNLSKVNTEIQNLSRKQNKEYKKEKKSSPSAVPLALNKNQSSAEDEASESSLNDVSSSSVKVKPMLRRIK